MNKSTLLAIVCVALVAVTTACRPAATPMAIATDTPTPVPPTATPLPTPTATPSPTLAPTSTPLPTVTPVPPTPSLTPVPTSTPLPTVTPVPPTPTATSLPPTLTPTVVPTTPEAEGEYIRLLAVYVPDRVPPDVCFPVKIHYTWSFRDKGRVSIGAEGGGGWRGMPGLTPTEVTGEGEFTHGFCVLAPDCPGLHTFAVSAYGRSAGSSEPNLIDRWQATVTVVPVDVWAGIDSEVVKEILPSASELEVDRLEFEEFIMGGEEFYLPIFRVDAPDHRRIFVDLNVFANADSAGRYIRKEFSNHETRGDTPIWTDLGDESFTLQEEVRVRVERYILAVLGLFDLDQIRPSVQRLQTLAPPPIPTTPASLCEYEPWGWFEGALEMVPDLREEIGGLPPGCPMQEHQVLTAVSQDFQGGYMVWREDRQLVYRKMIYVLYEEGSWESYLDRWQQGMPELDPSFGPPPEGLMQPKRGFGLVWQEHPEVRQGLGWAFNEERACDGAHLQAFGCGLMIECTQFVMPRQKTRIFILFDDGTYTIYMP